MPLKVLTKVGVQGCVRVCVLFLLHPLCVFDESRTVLAAAGSSVSGSINMTRL